ncbi:MAG: hypothetical protein FJ308_08080, partial [Planctomycetes bacterium]|nr:hypothetical protein [Planctomycetota bacterium]
MMDRTNSNTSSLSRDRVISSEVHVPCSVDAIFDNPKQVWKNRFSQFIVILIGAAAMAATYPGRTHGLGMVTEPLLNDFGLAT